jgi:hypothetical protein
MLQPQCIERACCSATDSISIEKLFTGASTMPNTNDLRTARGSAFCQKCGETLKDSGVTCPQCSAKPTARDDASLPSSQRTKVLPGLMRERQIAKDSLRSKVNEPADAVPASAAPLEGHSKQNGIICITLACIFASALCLRLPATYLSQHTHIFPGAKASVIAMHTGNDNAARNDSALIDAARSAMLRGDLGAARRHLALLSTKELHDLNVEQLTAQLTQRENARDAALARARVCEKSVDSLCLIHAAAEALASDIANSEAREILLRAAASAGPPVASDVGTSVAIKHQEKVPKPKTQYALELRQNIRDIRPVVAMDDPYARP